MVNLADLPNAGALSGSETLPMQQGSGAVKVTANQLLSRAAGQVIPFDIGGSRIATITSSGFLLGQGGIIPTGADMPTIQARGGVTASTGALRLSSSDNSLDIAIYGASGVGSIGTISSHPLQVRIGNSERARFDTSGNFLLAKASVSPEADGCVLAADGILYATNTNNTSLALNRPGTNGPIATFQKANVLVGTITVSGSSTSYNTTSDYRLKDGVVEIGPVSAIDRVKQLRPVRFSWLSTGEVVDGFLAHEAAEVVPEAVTGEKDAVEEIGDATGYREHDPETGVPILASKETLTGIPQAEAPEGYVWTKTGERPVYQGIDQSKLVPLLAAGLKAAIGEIEALQARVAALEAAT